MKDLEPCICVIDDSMMTTTIYEYLFHQFFKNPKVSVYNHTWDVDIRNFGMCDLLMIDEIMDDMSGTQFIKELLVHYYHGRYHEFPNVIFASTLQTGDLHERIKSIGIDLLIPAYRVLQKPLNPNQMKQTILSICPNMEHCITQTALAPNSELPWAVSVQIAAMEIFGVKGGRDLKNCMISV
jgi:hypothetical protein